MILNLFIALILLYTKKKTITEKKRLQIEKLSTRNGTVLSAN